MILPRRPILKCVHPWNQARNYFGKWTSGNLMPLEPGPSQRSLSTYHFLPLFQWPKIQKLLSGKWLCLHELHWPRVQHVWAPGEGSMAGLCHSPHHWLTPVTLSLPCLVTHTRCATCLASLSRARLMQAAGCCNLSGKQEAHGSSGTLQNREKHSLKQPWVRPAVRTSPPGVYSSLLRAWQQRTRPLQISPDLGGREPQER